MSWYLDYSAGKISAQAIRTSDIGAGGERAVGCIRYIDAPSLMGTKHTNRGEYQDHLANGLDDFLVIERQLNDCLGGYPKGRALMQAAIDGAHLIGYQGSHIFVTCDRHFIQPSAGPPVSAQVWQDFLGGAGDVIGQASLGAYAFSEGIDTANGHATGFWQAGTESLIRPWTHFWQDNNWKGFVGGVEVDRNRRTNVPLGGDMPVTPDDVERIRQAIFGTMIPLKQLNPDGTVSGQDITVSFEELHKYDDARIQGVGIGLARVQAAFTAATAALADAIKAGDANELTEEKMRAIMNDALANAVVHVDVNVGGKPITP